MIQKRFRNLGIGVLIAVLAFSATVFAAPYGSRSLYRGTFGGDVAQLQLRLNALGYDAGATDGAFGDQTRAAVLKFQSDYGLVPDGTATKWTFRAVDRAYTWKQGSFYTVVPGDTLWAIAEQEHTTVDQLRWLNQLQDDMLYPDQQLRVPGSAPAADPVPAPAPAPDPAPAENTDTATPAPSDTTAPAPAPAENTGTAAPAPSDATAPAPDQTTTAPAPEPKPAPKYEVLGFYAEDWQGDMRSLNSLKLALSQINTVVNFSLKVDAAGTVTTREYPELTALAAAQGFKVQGLVHNFGGSGFDADVARAVLGNPATRATTVKNLVATAKQYGLSGINVDIENVPPDQRAGYTALIKELKEALAPQGLLLTISIPAKTWDDTKSAWSGAFDYKALGQYADKVILMAYDEYLPGYYAGPVAGLPWVEAVAKFAASQMDPQKVLLGIAAYGYDWQKGTTIGRGLSVPQAVSLSVKYGATVQWDAQNQVPWFTYTNDKGQERIVYYEDARSLAPKLDLVTKYNLAGIAIWRLGLEDPAI
ncbi:MAG TPA: glycosyl hydrolase family 18 protein [Symbiobacteriaceae bacterium]|nr:glycosyl hydrolase family 18 protein [Symbiobacteriaceae bacterium]